MTPLAKGLGLLFGAPAILAVVFVTYFNATGEERMRAVCGEVTPGMTRDRVSEFARDKRLNGTIAETGTTILADPRSYGRHACKLTLAAGVVKAAEYSYAD